MNDAPDTTPERLADMIEWAGRRLAACESRADFQHNVPRYRNLLAMLGSLELAMKGDVYGAGFEAAKRQAIALCDAQANVGRRDGGRDGRLEAAVCGGIAEGIRGLRPSAAATGEPSPPMSAPAGDA